MAAGSNRGPSRSGRGDWHDRSPVTIGERVNLAAATLLSLIGLFLAGRSIVALLASLAGLA